MKFDSLEENQISDEKLQLEKVWLASVCSKRLMWADKQEICPAEEADPAAAGGERAAAEDPEHQDRPEGGEDPAGQTRAAGGRESFRAPPTTSIAHVLLNPDPRFRSGPVFLNGTFPWRC